MLVGSVPFLHLLALLNLSSPIPEEQQDSLVDRPPNSPTRRLPGDTQCRAREEAGQTPVLLVSNTLKKFAASRAGKFRRVKALTLYIRATALRSVGCWSGLTCMRVLTQSAGEVKKVASVADIAADMS
jgi:hypothetical protein